MAFNQIFDFTGLTGFDNNNLGHDDSSTVDDIVNAFNWESNTDLDLYAYQHAGTGTDEKWCLHPPNVCGLSQPGVEMEASGGLSGLLDIDYPATASSTFYPTDGVFLGEGKSSCRP